MNANLSRTAPALIPPQRTPENTCPWCEGPITRARFTEIQERIAEQERKRLADERKRTEALNRQLEKKTANELGEGGEIDIFEALRAEFPKDDISRVKKGQPGVDIVIEVLHKGTPCGKIVIDSKNRSGWQNAYVMKLR